VHIALPAPCSMLSFRRSRLRTLRFFFPLGNDPIPFNRFCADLISSRGLPFQTLDVNPYVLPRAADIERKLRMSLLLAPRGVDELRGVL